MILSPFIIGHFILKTPTNLWQRFNMKCVTRNTVGKIHYNACIHQKGTYSGKCVENDTRVMSFTK